MKSTPERRLQFVKRLIPLLPVYVIAALMAWGLKYHYSQAGSNQLGWMLTPTAKLVQHVTGIAFTHEENSGYVNRQHGLIIAPACAGINFFIIAFCLSAFSFLHCCKLPDRSLLWLLLSLPLAYAWTLVVNTLRIAVAILLYDADIYSGWITPRQVHRIAGVIIYLGALFGLHAFLNRLFHTPRATIKGMGSQRVWPRPFLSRLVHLGCHNAIPVFWYCLIALAVPLANFAFESNPARFVEHAGIVIAVCTGLWAGMILIQLCYRQIQAKMGNRP